VQQEPPAEKFLEQMDLKRWSTRGRETLDPERGIGGRSHLERRGKEGEVVLEGDVFQRAAKGVHSAQPARATVRLG